VSFISANIYLIFTNAIDSVFYVEDCSKKLNNFWKNTSLYL